MLERVRACHTRSFPGFSPLLSENTKEWQNAIAAATSTRVNMEKMWSLQMRRTTMRRQQLSPSCTSANCWN